MATRKATGPVRAGRDSHSTTENGGGVESGTYGTTVQLLYPERRIIRVASIARDPKHTTYTHHAALANISSATQSTPHTYTHAALASIER